MKKETAGCLAYVLALIVAIIIWPVLYYFFGWATGHILKFFIGNIVINVMNDLFNTTRFTTDMLPTICGTLGVIGSFFKSAKMSTDIKGE